MSSPASSCTMWTTSSAVITPTSRPSSTMPRQPKRLAVIATSAARDAVNPRDLTDSIHRACGLRLARMAGFVVAPDHEGVGGAVIGVGVLHHVGARRGADDLGAPGARALQDDPWDDPDPGGLRPQLLDPPGHDLRPDRPQRRRQDDAVQRDQPALPGHHRAGDLEGGGVHLVDVPIAITSIDLVCESPRSAATTFFIAATSW